MSSLHGRWAGAQILYGLHVLLYGLHSLLWGVGSVNFKNLNLSLMRIATQADCEPASELVSLLHGRWAGAYSGNESQIPSTHWNG